MQRIIKRMTLTDQAADVLREGIKSGRWPVELPSEEVLCHELNISRVTLRRALRQLAIEHLINPGGHGRRTQILTPKPLVSKGLGKGKIVRYLTPIPLHRMAVSTQMLQRHLQQQLQAAGYGLAYELHPGLYQRFSCKEMARIAALPDTAGWVLYVSTFEIQQWFQAAGIPCVVTGNLHPGIELANVAFDVRASCAHAANLFLARGHRYLVFVTPEKMTAGDKSSLEGFLQAARQWKTPVQTQVLNIVENTTNFVSKLDALFITPNPPTAFLTAWAEHSLTLMGYFHRHGKRIPEDASIISRFDEPFLEYCIPTVARYHMDCEQMGKKTSELLLELIEHGLGKIRHHLITPEFVAGLSLGNAPVNARLKPQADFR